MMFELHKFYKKYLKYIDISLGFWCNVLAHNKTILEMPNSINIKQYTKHEETNLSAMYADRRGSYFYFFSQFAPESLPTLGSAGQSIKKGGTGKTQTI